MKLSEREICFGLNLDDLKPGNHIYLNGYHCEGADFIVGCVGVNNKVISVFRPNNPNKIEYIDMYKISIPDLFLSLSFYEDSNLVKLSERVETIDEISIERNPTIYHHDFRLRELLNPPQWSWQTNCDVSKLKNGDKLVIHYFTAEDELKIRTLEMGDFCANSIFRMATMYYQYCSNLVKIGKINVIIVCYPYDSELEGTGNYDFKFGNNIIVRTLDKHNKFNKEFQFYRICGLQLVPKK